MPNNTSYQYYSGNVTSYNTPSSQSSSATTNNFSKTYKYNSNTSPQPSSTNIPQNLSNISVEMPKNTISNKLYEDIVTNNSTVYSGVTKPYEKKTDLAKSLFL